MNELTRRFPGQPGKHRRKAARATVKIGGSTAHEHHFQRKIDTVESLRGL